MLKPHSPQPGGPCFEARGSMLEARGWRSERNSRTELAGNMRTEPERDRRTEPEGNRRTEAGRNRRTELEGKMRTEPFLFFWKGKYVNRACSPDALF